MRASVDNHQEIRFIRVALFITAVAFSELFYSIAHHLYHAYRMGHTKSITLSLVFAGLIFFSACGTFLYHFCLAGYYKRRIMHTPATRDALEAIYDEDAKIPSLAVLIPSYKEELTVIRQTMLSAALAEYPQKSVVLLIDDPYSPRVLEDVVKLEKARELSGELQELFDTQLQYYRAQQVKFSERCARDDAPSAIELNRLSLLFEEVAEWLENLACQCQDKRNWDALPHGEQFFITHMVLQPAKQHTAYAQKLRSMIMKNRRVNQAYLERQYARLCAFFTVTFSSFERKQYVNLSHESNKAMNLNSYIGLMGKSWHDVKTSAGLELRECSADDAELCVDGFDLVNTIDADTLMTGDYLLRLVHEMQQPGRERLAIAQSPVTSIPGSPHALERAAGAHIDVQYITHQGYTYWGSAFWVGANALLRREALEDIKETRMERGHEVAVYIQDRTVIEDTESSIDLSFKGWQIFSYPERMTFSPTPPDFGSLLIQRRRWANGGLIILPKLFAHMSRAGAGIAPHEFFLRFFYLASTVGYCAMALMLLFVPFGTLTSTYWLPLSIAPFIIVFTRDLRNAGYSYLDALRLYAVNMMLFPIIMGGIAKQFQQIITGKKIPFGRTPKVSGRTSAPLLYYFFEILMFTGFAALMVKNIHGKYWLQALFCGLNAGCMAYVLTSLIGIKEMGEDLVAVLAVHWRKAFHHAEIIPMPSRWVPSAAAYRGLTAAK